MVVFTVWAGLIALAGRRWQEQGRFEELFILVVLCYFLPISLTNWVVELPAMLFPPSDPVGMPGGLSYLPPFLNWARHGIGILWVWLLLTGAVSHLYRVARWQALAVVFATMIPTLAIVFTYIR